MVLSPFRTSFSYPDSHSATLSHFSLMKTPKKKKKEKEISGTHSHTAVYGKSSVFLLVNVT